MRHVFSVVLLSLKRVEHTVIDNDIVADKSKLASSAELTVGDITSRDIAYTRYLKDFSYKCNCELILGGGLFRYKDD